MNPVSDPPGPARPADGSPVKFPVAPHANAASYFDAYADEITRAAKTIEPLPSTARAPSSSRRMRAAPGRSRAATAARRRSRTTCNATT